MRLSLWCGLYAVAGVLGRVTIIDDQALSLVWPAAGVGALWIATSTRQRLPVDLLAMAGVVYVVNAATGASPALGAVFVVTNLLQALVFAVLVGRLRPGLCTPGGDRAPRSLDDLGVVGGSAAAACLVAAAVGHLALTLLGLDPTPLGFALWWGRNLTGILTVGVLGLLVIARYATPVAGQPGARLSRRTACEAVALSALSLGLVLAIFGRAEAPPVGFLLLFATVIAGVRLGPLGAGLHGLGTGGAAVAFTLLGRGPFAGVGDLTERALYAQVFVTMTVLTGLVLAFNRAERNRALLGLQALQADTADRAQLFEAVLEHMREGVVVTDAQGEFLLRNTAGRALLGELPGDSSRVQDPAYYDMRHLDGSTVLAEERPFRLAVQGHEVLADYLLRPRDGRDPIVLEVAASPLPPSDPSDPQPRAIITYRDVTALRHDRDALASFSGVVAHDLKRPLTVINGWSEALAERFADGAVEPGDGLRMLDRVTGAAVQMGRFIDDLLSYTVVRDAPVQRVDVDLSAAADDAAAVFRERENRPQVYVQTGLHALADPVMVRQVLDNLIGNATKYVAPGVRPRVQVRGREDADWTLLTVTDNGIGIPPDQREQVFETFHRAHGEAYRGTGLGLAIVRRAVERCGGSVVVRDNPGGGTVFEVRLPAAPLTEVVEAPTPDGPVVRHRADGVASRHT
ncbi:PAS domain-containing protein [Nocardioides aurantiacus]|uniref:Sensor-like histidine kinase SenX3 n=1 Tax=Nocardioides aurantiacus TaxID=86796 RepID=A0A3N2CZN9_9ACTN|nr:PAS domain-containing protein [Nocardioides aurantiacus]